MAKAHYGKIFVLCYSMKYLIICLALLFCKPVLAQKITASLLKKEALQADVFVGADKFSNIYYIKKRTLYKRQTDGIIEYAALNLGEITRVDLINPLKISVYYKQANTLVLLDNTLNEINRFDFSTIEDFRNTSFAGTANDRRLWIFNTDTQQVELYDYRLNKVVVQFPPLEAIPTAYSNNFNFCSVQNEGQLTTYNIYGTITLETPTEITFEKLSQSKNTIAGLHHGVLYLKNDDNNAFQAVENLEFTAQEFSLIGEILYIYDGQNLMTYTIKPSK